MCLPCFTEVFVEEELPKKKEEVLYTVWDGKTRQYIKVPKSMVCNFALSYDHLFPFPSVCLAAISEGSVASLPILWSHIHFETREINNKQPRQHRVILKQSSLRYKQNLEPLELLPDLSISTTTPHCSIDASWPLQNRTSNLKLVIPPLARISIHTFLEPMVASSLVASHMSVKALLPFPSLAVLQRLLSSSRLRLLQLYRLHTPTTCSTLNCTLNSQVFLCLLQFKKSTLYQQHYINSHHTLNNNC